MLNLNNDEKIKIFSNKIFVDMMVLDLDNKPYFPAEYVTRLLQYDISIINRICILENPHVAEHIMWYQTGVKAFNEPILTQIPVLFIDEDNVRRLIVESVFDKKEDFEKWIFEEIIPTFK